MKTEAEILAYIDACHPDGTGGTAAEIHQEDWPVADVLMAKGLITLSDPEGPGRRWKRARLVATTKPERKEA